MSDVDRVRALIQEAKRPEHTLQLCLRGELSAQIDDLERELLKLSDGLDTLGKSPDAQRLAQQIEDLVEEAKSATITVRLRALPRRQWQDLVAKYPSDDKDYLFDSNKLYNEAVPLCWAEPELDPDTLDKLLDELTQGQWDELVSAVAALNIGGNRVPFSAAASATLRRSAAASRPQDRSE